MYLNLCNCLNDNGIIFTFHFSATMWLLYSGLQYFTDSLLCLATSSVKLLHLESNMMLLHYCFRKRGSCNWWEEEEHLLHSKAEQAKSEFWQKKYHCAKSQCKDVSVQQQTRLHSFKIVSKNTLRNICRVLEKLQGGSSVTTCVFTPAWLQTHTHLRLLAEATEWFCDCEVASSFWWINLDESHRQVLASSHTHTHANWLAVPFRHGLIETHTDSSHAQLHTCALTRPRPHKLYLT